jgi:hypothetical protein
VLHGQIQRVVEVEDGAVDLHEVKGLVVVVVFTALQSILRGCWGFNLVFFFVGSSFF